MAINLGGVVANINKLSPYTPIIEAIVNAIQAIEKKGETKGRIDLHIQREKNGQESLMSSYCPITGFIITDNGIGMTNENTNSFDTLYSKQKIAVGGKGFGRCTYLKFFQDIIVESIYEENGTFKKRSFKLTDRSPNTSLLPYLLIAMKP